MPKASNPPSNLQDMAIKQGWPPLPYFSTESRMTKDWQRIAKGLLDHEAVLLEAMSLMASDTKPLALLGKGLICDIKDRMQLALDAHRYGDLKGLTEEALDVVEKLKIWGLLTDKEVCRFQRIISEV